MVTLDGYAACSVNVVLVLRPHSSPGARRAHSWGLMVEEREQWGKGCQPFLGG